MKKLITISILALSVFQFQTVYAQPCTAPIINSFSPNTGFIGSTVTISGAFFSTTPSSNQVFFGATQATVLTASFGTLTVVVPVGATTALISVKNNCNLTAYSKVPFNGIFCPTPLSTTTYQNTAFTLAAKGAYNMQCYDMDLDGKPDVISGGVSAGGFTIARNTSTPGNLSFDRFDINTGAGPSQEAIADFDGDGKLDIAFTPNGALFAIRNLSTAGNLSFGPTLGFGGAGGYQIAAGDFNNDGKIDLVYGTGGSLTTWINTSTGIGSISFVTNTSVGVTFRCTGIQCADVDGDGKTDILATQGDGNRAVTLRNTTTALSGTFSFEAPEFWSSNGNYPYRCQIADFDKDGKIDLTTCNYNNPTNTAIFRNTSTVGNISFAASVNLVAPVNNYRIQVGDVNGDGLPDIVTKSLGVNVFSVYPNTSSGPGSVTFGARIDYSSSTQAEVSGIVIGDLDGDFVPDIATSGISSNTIRFHRNTSSQVDITPPTAICQNITAALSPSGTVNVTANMINNGSSDACGLAPLLINGSASVNFTCANVGPNTVTLTVTDLAGNTATCTSVVTVSPAAVIVSGQTTVCQGQTVPMSANLGDSYQWYLNGVPITGATSQTYTATVSGSYSVEVFNAGGCSGISPAVNITVNSNSAVSTIPSGNATMCPSGTLTITASQSSTYQWKLNGTNIPGATAQSYTAAGAGSYQVEVLDLFGCLSTSNPVVVTVVDNQVPVIACSGNITVNNSPSACNALVTVPSPTITDNCATTLTNSFNGTANASGTYPVGTTTVLWTATDGSGNSATCTQTITVVDNQIPGGAGSNYPAPAIALSNVPEAAGYNLVYSLDIPNGANWDIPSQVPYSVNNVATLGSLPYTRVAYLMELNSSWVWVSFNAHSSNLNNLGIPVDYFAQQQVSNMNVFSNVPGIVTGTGISTGSIEFWSHCYATGAGLGTIPSGNNGLYDFNDNPQGQGADCYGSFQISNYGSNQNIMSYNRWSCCSNSDLGIGNQVGGSGHPDWTFAVNAGNYSVKRIYVLVNNGSAPLACNNITRYLSASGNVGVTLSELSGGANDNCGIASITASALNFNCSNIGANNVVVTATDIHGNVATCNSVVTVLDNQAPTALCQNITVQLDSTGSASITAAQVNNGSSDNCGIASMNVSPSTFNCSNIGATVPSSPLTVVSDNTWTKSTTTQPTPWPGCACAPWAQVSSLPVSGTFTQPVTINQYSLAALVPGSSGILALSDVTFYRKTFNLSNNAGITATILGSADNALQVFINGNFVSRQSTLCEPNFDATHSRAIINPSGANTNGGIGFDIFSGGVTTANSSSIFVAGTNEIIVAVANCATGDQGAFTFGLTINQTILGTPVTLTLTDASGNSSSCTSLVTVVDNTAPVFTCPANISMIATSAAGAVVFYTAPTATDNCSATVAFTAGLASGSTFPIGITTVTYTATDPSGNSSQCSFIVDITGLPPTIACPANITVNSTPGQCGANVNYSATVTQGIPAPSVTYSIAPGSFFNAGATVTVTATAANAVGSASCSFNVTVTPEPLVGSVTAATYVGGNNISCNGASDGSATVNVTGGCLPYTYNWSPSAQTAPNANGLSAGNYTVTVTDAIGTTASYTVALTQPAVLVAGSSSGAIACFGGTTTVTVSANGGTVPYTGTGSFIVSAGTHNYIVTDANGCTANTSIVVTEPALLTAASSSGAIACFGGPTTVSVVGSGGTAPYTGTGLFTVSAGTHNYTITDANGCSANTSIVVTQPTLLTAASSSGAIACFGGTTTVTVVGSGGTAPYTGTGSFIVSAGTHSYVVTDANGCTANTSVTVTQPSALTASVANPATSSHYTCAFGSLANLVIGYGNGPTSATLNGSAAGGTGAYAYSWSPIAGLDNANIVNPVFTPSGTTGCAINTFELTVTDANGCVTTAGVNVNVAYVRGVGNNQNKVNVCHSAATQEVDITVSVNAVPSHLAHGDCIGDCQDNCDGSGRGLLILEREVGSGQLDVYPNPSNGQFLLDFKPVLIDAPIELMIMDVVGKVVYTKVYDATKELHLDVNLTNSISSGFYSLKITNGEYIFNKKIDVKK